MAVLNFTCKTQTFTCDILVIELEGRDERFDVTNSHTSSRAFERI